MNGAMSARIAQLVRSLIVTCLIGLLAAASDTSHAAGVIRTVALSGQHPPGTPSGVAYGDTFGTAAAINDAGQVAFDFPLVGGSPPGALNEGIWSEGSGNLALVARGGDPAPGPSGSTYYGFFLPLINNVGFVAFRAT